MSDSSRNIDEFISHARPNIERNCGAYISCACVESENRFVALSASVFLLPEEVVSAIPLLGCFSVEQLWVVAGPVSPSDVPKLFEDLRSGCLSGRLFGADAPSSISFVSDKGTPPQFRDPRFISDAELPNGLRCNAWRLEADIAMPRDMFLESLLERVELRLPANDPPFRDLNHLASDYRLKSFSGGRSSSISVYSPILLSVAVDNRTSDKTLEVNVGTLWKDLRNDASVSIIPHDEYSTERCLSIVREPDWSLAVNEGIYREYRREFVFDATGPFDVFLNFQGSKLSHVRTGLPSVRAFTHAMVDEDFSYLRRCLSPEVARKSTQDFERAVAWLLHLAGFSSIHYGVKSLSRAPDVVAFYGDQWVIYGECTVELPDSAKVRALRSRADALKNSMERRHSIKLKLGRAIFLPIARDGISDEDRRSAYEEDHVTLIAREELEAILDGAIRGESAAVALGKIIGTVPPYSGVVIG